MTAYGFWPGFRRALLLGGAWMLLAFLVLPMLVIVPVSLTDRPFLSLPQESLSLQHYRAFFHSAEWLGAAGQSILIAVAATAVSVTLGTLAAVGCWRLSNGVAGAVRLLMLAPIIVPTVVQGLAFYRFWSEIGLFDSYAGVILAHSLLGLPYVMITVSTSLAGFDPRLEQASRSLGAGMGATLRHVILPGISPGLLAGALLAFTHSFDELVIVLFITSRDIATLPKRIWDGIEDNVDPTIAAAAVLLILLTVAGFLLTLIARRLRLRRPEPRWHPAEAEA